VPETALQQKGVDDLKAVLHNLASLLQRTQRFVPSSKAVPNKFFNN